MSMKKASAAVVALHQLLAIQSGEPVSLERLKESTNLSTSYLELLFASLRRAGLVVSTRGPGGGYIAPEEITVGDVVSVFVTKGFLLTTSVKTALNGVRIADLPEGFSW